MPSSACVKLAKEQRKTRLCKAVIGKGRSQDDNWRSGEGAVLTV